jgi:hypothetical protein
MNFYMKFYTLTEYNIVYVHIYFSDFFKNFEIEILKFSLQIQLCIVHVNLKVKEVFTLPWYKRLSLSR